MADDREQWAAKMRRAEVIDSPLAPPAACARCLRPLESAKRGYGMCYDCGRVHPQAPLARISAITYGAAGTRPWEFFTTTKLERASAERLDIFVTGIAATLSLAIEQDRPDFLDGDVDHVMVTIPSSSRLIARCAAAMAAHDFVFVVLNALTAEERPRQTDLDMSERRDAAAGKYLASAELEGKNVLLLDDAYTSGYTAHDAARAAGARSVA